MCLVRGWIFPKSSFIMCILSTATAPAKLPAPSGLRVVMACHCCQSPDASRFPLPCCMGWRVSKTTPSLAYSLREFTWLNIQSYSWLRSIPLKGYKGKSTKVKVTWGEVQKKPGTSSQCSPSAVGKSCLILPTMNCDGTCEMLSSRGAHQKLSAQGF